MTKYATFKKYESYIKVIMDDLGLTGKVIIEWEFGVWRRMGGDAVLYATEFENGMRFGRIRIAKNAAHKWTLEAIMHELKHIQQYQQKRLHLAYPELVKTNRGTDKTVWKVKWMDQIMDFHDCSKNPKIQTMYMNQPWEVEAYDYQKEIYRLFPKLNQKTYIGAINNIKFYKTKG